MKELKGSKYLITLLIVGFATGVQWLLWPIIEPAPFILYYPAIILASLYGEGLSAIVLSALIAQYLFVPPMYSFAITWPGDVVRQALFLLNATLLLYLTRTLSMALRRAQDEKTKSRESEAWLRTTLSSIGDAVIATDREGRVAFMNPIAEALTEWSLMEAKGRTLSEVFHIVNQQTRLLVENPVAKVLEKGGIVGLANHTVIIGRKGKEAVIEDSAAPIRISEGGQIQGVVLVFRDITETYSQREKLAEAFKQLQLSEARIKSVLENALDGVVGMDTEGLITHWNPHAKKIFGYSMEEAIGRRMSETIIPHQFREAHERGMKRYLASGEGPVLNQRIEITALRRDGSEFPIELAITPVKTATMTSFAAFIRDITEHKQAEQKVVASEEQFRALVDASTQIVWTTTPSGEVVEDSPSWRAFTGQSYDQWKGWGWLNAFHPEDRELTAANWKQALESCTPLRSEYRLRHVSGEWRWIAVRAVPLLEANGTVRGWVGMNTDITERVQSQVKMEEANRQLAEALRARDEFLSIASHELKTPLTSLKLQTQMLQRGIAKQDPKVFTKESVEMMIAQTDKQVTRLTRLIDDTLDISRIRVGKLTIVREPIDLAELVKESIDRMAAQFTAAGCGIPRIEFRENAQGEWDRMRIEQVINNLFTNAIRYGKGKPVEVRISSQNGSARLEVKDHGIGIAHDMKERIFDRFERAVSASEVSGLGLGLFITKQIVLAHGGSIWVESEIGKGSAFYVDLPLVEPDQPKEAVDVL